MSDISPYSRHPGEPEPLTRQQRTQLDQALMQIEGPDEGYIIATAMPVPFRRWLEDRRDTLVNSFRPAAPRERREVLVNFFGAYTGAGRLSANGLDSYLANAEETLHGFPLWLLRSVVSRFRRAVAGNPGFVPTVPELTQEATTLLEPWLKEATDIARLLRARVIAERVRTLDENARIDAAVAAFKAESPAANEDERERRINSIVMAAAADWQMAGNLKKRGMTSATLDERLAIAREYQPDPTGASKWDSRKGPAGTGRPPEVTVAQMRAEAALLAQNPPETAAETLARTSGLPISDVLVKLNEVPDKPPPAA